LRRSSYSNFGGYLLTGYLRPTRIAHGATPASFILSMTISSPDLARKVAKSSRLNS
jgi:hypothetical protein